MVTHLIRASAMALALALSAGCNKDAPVAASVSPEVARIATESPAAAVTANVALLKAGNFAALMQNALPPEQFNQFKAEWTKQKDDEPVTDEDREKFAAMMAQLTAPDAEAKLYAEAGPKLKALEQQYQSQVPMYVNMARGVAQNMAEQSKDLTDEQKQQSIEAINAIGDWALTAKFANQDLLKQGIAIAVDAARTLDVKTIEQARAMDFDTAMRKGQVAFVALKKLLALYGLSIDDTLDSVKPTVISSTDTDARVRIDYQLFGKSMSTESDMVKIADRWYSKDTIEKNAVTVEPKLVPDSAPEPAAQKD